MKWKRKKRPNFERVKIIYDNLIYVMEAARDLLEERGDHDVSNTLGIRREMFETALSEEYGINFKTETGD